MQSYTLRRGRLALLAQLVRLRDDQISLPSKVRADTLVAITCVACLLNG